MAHVNKPNKEVSIYKQFPAQVLNNTTIKTITNGASILVSPSEVFFKDVEPGHRYEVKIMVQNIAKKLKHFLFTLPKSTKFHCDYQIQGPLAAGMAMPITVTFETEVEGNFHDTLGIQSEGEQPIEIPFHAIKASSDIKYEPLVNFGFVLPGQSKKELVSFKNEGKILGTVELQYEQTPDFKVDPKSFQIEPNKTTKIQFTFTAGENPDFIRKIIDVVVGQEKIGIIDVNATIVKQALCVVFEDGGGQTSEILFGNLYFGETKEIKASLVNNGPHSSSFNIKFGPCNTNLTGEGWEEIESIKTPAEVGSEMTDRPMTTEPLSGIIEPYSEIPIRFICRTKIQEKQTGFTELMKNDDDSKSNDYGDNYSKEIAKTALISAPEINQTITVVMKAKAQMHRVSLSKKLIQFPSCPLGEKKNCLLIMENKSDELPINFKFSKVAHFHPNIVSGKLLPQSQFSVEMIFEPNNLGIFTTIMNLELLNGSYKIPIKLLGSSNSKGISKKIANAKGAKVISGEEKTALQTTKGKETSMPTFMQDTTSMHLESGIKFEVTEKVDHFLDKMQNKERWNNYLTEARKKREKESNAMKKLSMTDKQPIQTLKEFIEDIDLGIGDCGARPPKLQIPTEVDPLWVLKPFAGHEPNIAETRKKIDFDDTKPIKKKFKTTHTTQLEARDCNEELDGEMLQKIHAGPNEIKFGMVFVESEETRYFSITNDLKQHIFVKLIIDHPELVKTNPTSQIIPPSQTSGFDIVFTSNRPQEFKKRVTYIINNKHTFKFMVSAKAEKVNLEFARNTINFYLSNENMERSITEIIRIKNNGNATAYYNVFSGKRPETFIPSPLGKDSIEKNQTKELKITYCPSPNETTEEDEIGVEMQLGEVTTISVKGHVNEGSCRLVDAYSTLDFGDFQVGPDSEEKIFKIKNLLRSVSIAHILNPFPELMITPSQEKIMPDIPCTFSAKFKCQNEKKFEGEITVLVRGGKSLKVPVKANAIIPKVSIEEDGFDFGGVIIGSSKMLPMTLKNESSITAHLQLLLKPYEDFELEIPKEMEDKSDIISVFYEEEEEVKQVEELSDEKSISEEEEEEEKEDKKPKNFIIHLDSKRSPLLLYLKYTPNSNPNLPDLEYFELPLTIQGIGPLSTIRKPVKAERLKPKLLIDPNKIDFEKKVISTGLKPFAANKEIQINNPGTMPVKWKIDTSQIEDEEAIFTLSPNEGLLDPGMTIPLRATFNPMHAKEYQVKLPVYLDDNENEPYMNLEIIGFGAEPKLTFDRKEIIMPPVPLGVESRAVFTIYNDGYENLDLTEKIPSEMGKIPIVLEYQDNNRNLGVTRKSVKVEAKYKHTKPFSFTTRIEFLDEYQNAFSIPISGTFDNCLLTNFPYLQRNKGEFVISEESGTIMIKEEVDSDEEDNSSAIKTKGLQKLPSKTASSVMSRNAQSIIGYTMVHQDLLEANAEYLMRWLSFNIPNLPSLTFFPGSVIQANGNHLIELIHFLTGKFPPKPAAKPELAKDQIQSLLEQYEEIIKYLKTNGAHLNTIRPEYLLSKSDFKKFYKKNFPNLQKHIEFRYAYLSVDAWITIFYQTIKIFMLSRVNAKSFKNTAGSPPTETVVSQNMKSSNLISESESILLKWMQYHYNKMDPRHTKNLINFDTDLQNSLVFSALIQSIYSNVKSLQGMKQVCENEADYLMNAQKFLSGLGDIGLSTYVTAKDIAKPTAREMVLFCMQLFQTLPHYVPKAIIEFPCILGEAVKKTIELTNPYKSPISYWVALEGSDFSIDQTEIRIEPDSTVNFDVTFTSRVSKVVNGKILFTNKKEGNIQAAPLAFDLKSNVYSRKSMRTWTKTTKLYEPVEIAIEVRNDFKQDVLFKVMLQYERRKPEVTTTKSKKGKGKGEETKVSSTVSDQAIVPDPFMAKIDNCRIKKGGTGTATIVFLPFEIGLHKCYVIFVDENVGEIQHEIVGTAELPSPLDVVREKIQCEQLSTIELNIAPKNATLERAKNIVIDRAAGSQKQKEKEIFKNNKLLSADQQEFEVQVTNTYFNAPRTIILTDKSANAKRLEVAKIDNSTNQVPDISRIGGAETKDSNKLVLQITAKSPAIYRTAIILSNANKTDIRVLEVVVTAYPPTVKALLEFVVPARGSVTQDIPFNNETEKDWSIKANLTFDKGKNGLFNAPKEIVSKKKALTNFPLTFKPFWLCDIEGKLVLSNVTTNQVYEYDLKGIGEEPLATDHVILKCKVKVPTKYLFEVKNTTDKTQVYRIETDLQNVSGPDSLKLLPNSSSKYEMAIKPMLGGSYIGSITFIDSDERYQWYTVEVHTESPKADKVLELKTGVRKAISVEISLKNPLNEPVVFDVDFKGEGLVGDSTFSIAANQVGMYQLIYSPFKPGESMGQIGFLSEKAGEFWYNLSLIADESPIINLDLIECELGKKATTLIRLENPTKLEEHIEYKISNKTNFDIEPERITLAPFSSSNITIWYIPSTLDTNENASIVFQNPRLGKWEFYIEGRGKLPTSMDPVPVSTTVGNSTSSVVVFNNPFKEPATVEISMETNDTKVFSLIIKRSKFTVGPLGSLQIPFSFTPHSMIESSAIIVVTMTKTLIWKYPIKGIAESVSHSTDFHFKCKARTQLDEKIKVKLSDIGDFKPEERFSFELVPTNKSLINDLERSVAIEQINKQIKSMEDPIEFSVKFEPLKPFKINAELLIYKKSGGRWRFNIIFESTEPDIDDVIVITSPLNKTSSVSFKLTNHMRAHAEFTAFFSPDSAPEFSVHPKAGILEPYGKEGTNFIVSFTPTEYGKPKKGKLIILTEEMQWSYEIKGTHPHYKIPDPKGGRLNNKLEKELEDKVMHKNELGKNFLAENKKTTKDFNKKGGSKESSPKSKLSVSVLKK